MGIQNGASAISQTALDGANIHNNINVSINYNIRNDKISQEDLMNSSLTKMLDAQLLKTKSNEKNAHRISVNKITDSLTGEIFNDGKIDLGNGATAFRPLDLETVQERPLKPS